MKEKFYLQDSISEHCYPLDYFEEMLLDGNDKELELIGTKRDIGSGYMWCTSEGESVESGDGACGSHCQYYEPCNGKNGRCRSLKHCFTDSGERFILNKDGLRPIKK